MTMTPSKKASNALRENPLKFKETLKRLKEERFELSKGVNINQHDHLGFHCATPPIDD